MPWIDMTSLWNVPQHNRRLVDMTALLKQGYWSYLASDEWVRMCQHSSAACMHTASLRLFQAYTGYCVKSSYSLALSWADYNFYIHSTSIPHSFHIWHFTGNQPQRPEVRGHHTVLHFFTRSKKFSPKNKKDSGMACHIPPLKKAKKQGTSWYLASLKRDN